MRVISVRNINLGVSWSILLALTVRNGEELNNLLSWVTITLGGIISIMH